MPFTYAPYPAVCAATLAAVRARSYEQLRAGMTVYDGLNGRCRSGQGETHDRKPERMRAAELAR